MAEITSINGNPFSVDVTSTAITPVVDAWLTAHPEATTTVQDGAITSAKMARYATPEEFGAIGDGTTDATSALNSALNSCRSDGRILSGELGATYAISGPIDFSGVNVDFGGATIKCTSPIEAAITVDDTGYFDNEHASYIKNLALDCSGVSGGIKYAHGFKAFVEHVTIINCNKKALSILAGAEVFVSNCHIECSGNSDSIGIELATSDCHVSDVVILDAHVAIANAGTNFYARVHGWNTAGNVSGTTFFVQSGGMAELVQCQCDTYEKGYYRATDKPLTLTNCTYYINSNLYDSATAPTVFWFETTAFAYSKNVSCIGCSFNILNTNTSWSNYASNLVQFVDCFIYKWNGSYSGAINSAAVTLREGITINDVFNPVNRIYYENGYIHIELRANVSGKAMGGPTTDVSVAQITDLRLMPSEYTIVDRDVLLKSGVWSGERTYGSATINQNNGIISIRATAGTYTLLDMHIKYKAKSSLDYYVQS